ncbi:MAG TPA: alpha/beta fold hydrolase, partial [Telluria sp.]|nr:alpha/beta fold hydrolase [Telluria sp.]
YHQLLAAPMFIRLLAALALLTATLAHAADAPPIGAFFDTPAFTGASLSPTGKYLAVRIGFDNGRERLAVVELASNKIAVVAHFTDADVNHFMWVNDERLVFDTRDRLTAPGDTRTGPGLWSVNRDGSGFRQLVNIRSSITRSGTHGWPLLPPDTFLLGQRTGQNDEFVYVVRRVRHAAETPHEELQRLNTSNGRTTSVNAPGDVMRWMLDARGEPRLALVMDKNVLQVWYRDPQRDDAWRLLRSGDTFQGEKFAPVGFTPDGSLYVAARKGEDQAALYKVNLADGSLAADPLLKVANFDFVGALVVQDGGLAGVRYVSDGAATVWLTPKYKALQETVDALLPSTINTISLPARPETPWALVVAESDVQPPVYLLFNTETQKFNRIGETRPGIRPQVMGKRSLVHIPARDGLELPAWLTLPAGRAASKLPLVVLVHGGPFTRGGYWHWEAQSQFLASRGYAVLEPEFRGSTGYGERLFRAGWKQWGLKMQDDVADATRWAIGKGYTDPARVCIAGASYGGYATLMGLINDPQLYKCGIEWAGVTDIQLLFTGNWSMSDDLTDEWRTYGMPVMIGDPDKDGAQFTATSPLHQAARLTQPLLLAYGTADHRVPIYHGKKFFDAVSKTNKQVEWIEYPEEGHGWALAKNRIDFWTRVEQFLDKNIGH